MALAAEQEEEEEDKEKSDFPLATGGGAGQVSPLHCRMETEAPHATEEGLKEGGGGIFYKVVCSTFGIGGGLSDRERRGIPAAWLLYSSQTKGGGPKGLQFLSDRRPAGRVCRLLSPLESRSRLGDPKLR